MRGFFDEYEYSPVDDGDIAVPSTTFEIALDTLLECLNVFGSGGGTILPAPSEKNGKRGWHNKGDDEDNDDRPNRTGALKTSWNKGAEKVTMMKMTYQDTGYPLTLILWAPIYASVHGIYHIQSALAPRIHWDPQRPSRLQP